MRNGWRMPGLGERPVGKHRISPEIIMQETPFLMLIRWLYRASLFWLRYRNPWQIMWQKKGLIRKAKVRVVDRKTGVTCECRAESFQMFGETWYNKDYDIPHFPIRADDTVLDIGANQGFFSCYVATKGARVFAFEPAPESFEILEANLKRNRLDDRVTAKPWAVAGDDGLVELACSSRLGGGMNTINPRFADTMSLDVAECVTVPCHTLPTIMDTYEIQRIRLCKLDCEGAELDILKRLHPSHLQRIDAFVLEYHPAYPLAELLGILLSWKGYQVSFAEDNPHCERNIIRVVANSQLLKSS